MRGTTVRCPSYSPIVWTMVKGFWVECITEPPDQTLYSLYGRRRYVRVNGWAPRDRRPRGRWWGARQTTTDKSLSTDLQWIVSVCISPLTSSVCLSRPVRCCRVVIGDLLRTTLQLERERRGQTYLNGTLDTPPCFTNYLLLGFLTKDSVQGPSQL